MEYGAHLPLIDLNGQHWSLRRLLRYTEIAERLDFRTLSANDHLLFSRPWIDGQTALAAVLARTGQMTLMTTVALPVVRGPVVLAKSLAAIDLLSDGRLVVGVGPGSSARDYAAVGISFEERWKRLDEAVKALRAFWVREAPSFEGRFYSTEGITLEPHPAQHSGPPIWIGSWGSDAGLRRTASLGDGWLASAYNTTPKAFTDALGRLGKCLYAVGRNPDTFPNAIATMFFYVTEDRAKAERIVEDILSPTLNRPAEELNRRLLVGSVQDCAEKGAQRVFVWPVDDELRQLAMFQERVAPLALS